MPAKCAANNINAKLESQLKPIKILIDLWLAVEIEKFH